MAVGDKIRKAIASPGDNDHWIYRLRYAIMLEIEDLKRHEDYENLSESQINALSPAEHLAFRLIDTTEILDVIAPVIMYDTERSATLANELSDYYQARTQDKKCFVPWGVKGALFTDDIGI